MRGIIGRFYKETCGDESPQTTRADGDADVCPLCLLWPGMSCGEKGTRWRLTWRDSSYQMGGRTLPYQGWWGSNYRLCEVWGRSWWVTKCFLRFGAGCSGISHYCRWLLSLSEETRQGFSLDGTLSVSSVNLRLDGSELPNLGLCFETPWKFTWNQAAACLIGASHANSANTPQLQSWLQSWLLCRFKPVPWTACAIHVAYFWQCW